MTEIEQIWKQDAIERMAENDRVIAAQAERIAILELHLGKLRDLLWTGYSNTSGVLPMEIVKEPPARRSTKKKMEQPA